MLGSHPSRTPQGPLGAGRSQVQILSPRSSKAPLRRGFRTSGYPRPVPNWLGDSDSGMADPSSGHEADFCFRLRFTLSGNTSIQLAQKEVPLDPNGAVVLSGHRGETIGATR